jgi:hypothetical protein
MLRECKHHSNAIVIKALEIIDEIFRTEDDIVTEYVRGNASQIVKTLLTTAQRIYDNDQEECVIFIACACISGVTKIAGASVLFQANQMIQDGMKGNWKQKTASLGVLTAILESVESALVSSTPLAEIARYFETFATSDHAVLREMMYTFISKITVLLLKELAPYFHTLVKILRQGTNDENDKAADMAWLALVNIISSEVRDSWDGRSLFREIEINLQEFLYNFQDQHERTNHDSKYYYHYEAVISLAEVNPENPEKFRPLLAYCMNKLEEIVSHDEFLSSHVALCSLMEKLSELFRFDIPRLAPQIIIHYIALLQKCLRLQMPAEVVVMALGVLLRESGTVLLPFVPPVVTQLVACRHITNYGIIVTTFTDIWRIPGGHKDAWYYVYDVIYDDIQQGLKEDDLVSALESIADIIMYADRTFRDYDRTVFMLGDMITRTKSADVLGAICDCYSAFTCDSSSPFAACTKTECMQSIILLLENMAFCAEQGDCRKTMAKKGIGLIRDLQADNNAEPVSKLDELSGRLSRARKNLKD